MSKLAATVQLDAMTECRKCLAPLSEIVKAPPLRLDADTVKVVWSKQCQGCCTIFRVEWTETDVQAAPQKAPDESPVATGRIKRKPVESAKVVDNAGKRASRLPD